MVYVMDLWSVKHGRHGPTVRIWDHQPRNIFSRSLSSLGWIYKTRFSLYKCITFSRTFNIMEAKAIQWKENAVGPDMIAYTFNWSATCNNDKWALSTCIITWQFQFEVPCDKKRSWLLEVLEVSHISQDLVLSVLFKDHLNINQSLEDWTPYL